MKELSGTGRWHRSLKGQIWQLSSCSTLAESQSSPLPKPKLVFVKNPREESLLMIFLGCVYFCRDLRDVIFVSSSSFFIHFARQVLKKFTFNDEDWRGKIRKLLMGAGKVWINCTLPSKQILSLKYNFTWYQGNFTLASCNIDNFRLTNKTANQSVTASKFVKAS